MTKKFIVRAVSRHCVLRVDLASKTRELGSIVVGGSGASKSPFSLVSRRSLATKNMATLKQTKKRASKMSKRTTELRDQLWPSFDQSKLWNRTTAKGFTTIPRAMPHLLEILDDLAGKGKPVSKVYLSLWCRVFDESFVEIKSYADLAYEGGFNGQRAVTMWRQRMKSLVDLGFILAEPGPGGEFDYVLLLNPFHVVKDYYEKKSIQKHKYTALFSRALDVGATDLQ